MSATVKSHNAFFISWMDNKPVHLLSSIRSEMGDCQRNASDRGKTNWRKVSFRQASIIKLYDSGMGGTDSLIKD
jgi:hypothetical protein